MIRGRISLGVRGNSIRQKLLQEKILEECIDICRTNEKTASQLSNIEELQYLKSMLLNGKPQPKKNNDSQKQEQIEVNKDMTKTSTCHLSTVETSSHQKKKEK